MKTMNLIALMTLLMLPAAYAENGELIRTAAKSAKPQKFTDLGYKYDETTKNCQNNAGQIGFNVGVGECGDLSGQSDFKKIIFPKNMRGANFDGSVLYRNKFKNIDLTGATFRSANIQGTNFINSDLKDVDFTDATINRVRGFSYIYSEFININTSGVKFNRAILSYVTFQNVKLRDSDFTGATIDYLYLYDVDMERVDFSNASVEKMAIWFSSLNYAKIPNTKEGIDIMGNKTSLRGADLHNSTIISIGKIDLREADLSGTSGNISEGNLSNANLRDSSVLRCKLSVYSSLVGARINHATNCNADYNDALVRISSVLGDVNYGFIFE